MSQEVETKRVTCPGCGQEYEIRKPGMEEVIEFGMIAVPSWFRDADAESRMLNLQARNAPDTRPDAIKWDEAAEACRMFKQNLALIEGIVVWPKILKRGEDVTDPDNEIPHYRVRMCCGQYLPEAIGEYGAEETEKLATFREERTGNRPGQDGAKVQSEAE